MTITKWNGCYDSSWKGLITDASFAHPAKMSRGLLERIIKHGFEKGYWEKGSRIGDCFGGVGTTGIIGAYNGLDVVLCELEPRFVKFANENFDLHRHGWQAVRGGNATIIQGDSRKFNEHVAAIVSSPPYAESVHDGNGIDQSKLTGNTAGKNTQALAQGYGESSGQIGSLKSGAVEAVISSPPFSPPNNQPKIGQNTRAVGGDQRSGYNGDRTSGNIETLKEGTVQGVIASPPYSETTNNSGTESKPERWGKSGQLRDGYGQSAGQISQLKGGTVEAVVSSPPWESNCEGNTKASKFNGYIPDNGKGHYASPEAKKRSAEKADSMEYGSSEGQIGKESGETYWEAVDAVYRACFRCIRPGGVIVLVVKDYCSKGKRVRLCDDTMKLLEHIGFVPLERIHAMLVSETVENGLFGEEKTTKQRKSFFRRLYEAKIPEGDERRIDHEEVLIARRP